MTICLWRSVSKVSLTRDKLMQMLLQIHLHVCFSWGALFTPGLGCKPCSDWNSTDLWAVPPWHGSNCLCFCGSRCHVLPTFIGMKVEVFLDSLDNLNEIGSLSSVLKLDKLGMRYEPLMNSVAFLNTCRSKKCAWLHDKECVNDEWIMNESYPRFYLGVPCHHMEHQASI